MRLNSRIAIASLLLVAAGALGCDLDRLDTNRGCDDVRQVDTTPQDSAFPTDTEDDTGPDTDTETDFSCHNIACETVEDCTCTTNVVCPQKGPSFIKNHCLIVDCDPLDSSTCPEGVQCVDATDLSFGEIQLVCFSM